MKNKWCHSAICIVCFLVLSIASYAQEHHLYGKVREKFSELPLAFTHILVNGDELEVLTDADGSFHITHSDSIKRLTFKHYQHRDLDYSVLPEEDSLDIFLQKYLPFQFEEQSHLQADRIIYNVLMKKKQNDAETFVPHSFNTYNKLIVETNKLAETKQSLEKKLQFLGIKLKPFKKDHNLFIVESVTESQYLDKLNQQEKIVSSKVSGIDETSIYTINSLLLPGSIYKDYLTLATFNFLSPLNDRAMYNYYFKITDTVKIDNETIYVIKFTPAKKNIDALKGLLFISSSSYAVTHFVLSPAYDSPPFEVAQSFKKVQGRWFPDFTLTNYRLKNYGRDNIRINAVAKTYRSDIQLRKDLKPLDFNDVILQYKKSANNQDESYWKEVRQEELTQRDINTYSYFDTIGSIKQFERYTRLGEGLYYGILPVKIINLEINRVLSANEYEGLRLGVGGHTNNLLSDRYSFGAYIGYGTKDGKFKYGINAKLIVDKKTEFTVSSSIYKDLREAAGVSFSFNRDQFTTESLRRYQIMMLDQVFIRNYEASIKPIRYLYLSSAINLEDVSPTYEYQYQEKPTKTFQVAEYKLGLKVAFGEQFIRSPQNKFSLPPKYPIFWFEYRKGLDNMLGNYDYHKLDFKIQYSLKKPGLGRQTIQITGGQARGRLPYFKLYNMEGSWRTFSVVIHNSFESMRYNEFLSDRYLAIHLAQDLGRKILFHRPFIAPGIEVLHSFGIGDLKNREDHQLIDFKTMEKGYLESGIFIYDILTFRPLGVRTGLGTGVFARYGPYARDKFSENFVYKLGLSFNL